MMIDPKYAPLTDSPEDAEFLVQINAMIDAQPEHRRIPFTQTVRRLLDCRQAEYRLLAELDPLQRVTLRTSLGRLPIDQWLHMLPTTTS